MIVDPDSFCPLFVGSTIINGSTVIVRTAKDKTQLKVPATLIKKIFHWCDGTRSITQIKEATKPIKDSQKVLELIYWLIQQNILIDAPFYTLYAADYASQQNSFGVSRPVQKLVNFPSTLAVEDVTSNPLHTSFLKRTSTYQFGEAELKHQDLVLLLWSLMGVVAQPHERLGEGYRRHTLASAGGLHLLQIYVVLQKPVGSYTCGTYRLHYPKPLTIALELIDESSSWLPRAFIKPWECLEATGAIFIIGDVKTAARKYRNRALQYQYMEAGAAIHNGALIAAELNLGFLTVGGFDEEVVQQYCGLDNLPLVSALFGTKGKNDTAKSYTRLGTSFRWLNLSNANYAPQVHVAESQLSRLNIRTWGADVLPELAWKKCLTECAERECFYQTRTVQSASLSDIDTAIHPDVFLKYSDIQYRRSNFPYSPFDPDEVVGWVDASGMTSGRKLAMLADLVHPQKAIANKTWRSVYTDANTSGCAADEKIDKARWRAIMELIERDAFMRHWLMQKSGQDISFSSLPDIINRRLTALQAAQCKLSAQLLDSLVGYVFLLTAQNDEKHFTTVAAAAKMDAESALQAALDELETRVAAWLSGYTPSKNVTIKEIKTPQQHADWYGNKKFYQRANLFLFPGAQRNFNDLFSEKKETFSEYDVDALAHYFAQIEREPVEIDLSESDAKTSNIHVVKVFIPGLIPISFGYGLEPLGMADFNYLKFPHPFS
ncbi:MAG: YcaO-like family protein [Burkholderiales bacterium]|nr:YcaO-like family protein [Burkholderiales bacterium]